MEADPCEALETTTAGSPSRALPHWTWPWDWLMRELLLLLWVLCTVIVSIVPLPLRHTPKKRRKSCLLIEHSYWRSTPAPPARQSNNLDWSQRLRAALTRATQQICGYLCGSGGNERLRSNSSKDATGIWRREWTR
jgi:hypothetical protein